MTNKAFSEAMEIACKELYKLLDIEIDTLDKLPFDVIVNLEATMRQRQETVNSSCPICEYRNGVGSKNDCDRCEIIDLCHTWRKSLAIMRVIYYRTLSRIEVLMERAVQTGSEKSE